MVDRRQGSASARAYVAGLERLSTRARQVPRHMVGQFGGNSVALTPNTDRPKVPHWLQSFLEEVMGVLRRGGWTDEEVSDILSFPSPPSNTLGTHNYLFDRERAIEEFLLHINKLSDSLRHAGWSSEDVAEAFDINCSSSMQEKRPIDIPDGVVAMVGRLSQYVGEP